jgi:hypothetical protein
MAGQLLEHVRQEVSMANYTLHLGFNWNSPTVGALWGGTDTDYRFLQYALADTGSHAHYFTFDQNDTFSAVIWNLSAEPLPSSTRYQLAISLSSLVAPAQTYRPTNYLTLPSSATQSSLSGKDYFQFTSISFADGPVEGSPWGTAQQRSTSDLGPMTFTIANARFKLSFKLTVTWADDTRVYISDPEVIVGSMGN